MRATLYVKGVRIKQVESRSQAGYYVAYPAGDPRLYPDYRVYKDVKYKSVLPEDQKAIVETVKALAVKHGFELTVVDVGENHFLDRLEIRLRRIVSFPTLLTDTGLRIEGDITEERIKTLLLMKT